MITDALLAPLVALVHWIAGFLPVGDPLSPNGLTDVRAALAALNTLVPISEVLTVLVTLMSAVGIFLVVRLVVWLWNLVKW
ncbi:MAG: hypothetical protein NVV66_01460 [Cellulomonas sp.]|uniref:hypothetical protein n=1 Tax=Cellulomonas sp. TaxID=40001 RepID=UPI0025851539|nr:hypothetical protein [Cellulomonas sp.]MCR6703404.1 hypothetical protein [Cellulomonas sp.]